MQLKCCVDAQYSTSCIVLGFIDNFTYFDDMIDEQLHACFDSEAEELKETVTIESLDGLIQKKPRMNIDNKDATPRMQG